MSVYCDVCAQPGSPNDDAGYTRMAAGFARHIASIEFTPEEKRGLAESNH